MTILNTDKVFVGVNWGAIEKTNILGRKLVPVDLDVCCAVKSVDGRIIELAYYASKDILSGAVKHSGDDYTGDRFGDDGLDNEVIIIELSSLPEDVKSLVFLLNSYSNIEFSKIPFASIRLYSGGRDQPIEVYENYNISDEQEFADSVSMILGEIYRKEDHWAFKNIGQATDDKTLEEVITRLKDNENNI